jgi:hypothetical protein
MLLSIRLWYFRCAMVNEFCVFAHASLVRRNTRSSNKVKQHMATMFHADVPLANFTISEGAKRGIELVRQAFNAHSSDPAAVVCIGWGRFTATSGPSFQNVVVSFYGQSYVPEIAEAIQKVSGLDVFFYANPRDYPRFEGKTLDFSEERGFFLRTL